MHFSAELVHFLTELDTTTEKVTTSLHGVYGPLLPPGLPYSKNVLYLDVKTMLKHGKYNII